MEERCQLLEGQIDHLRKDKEELLRKNKLLLHEYREPENFNMMNREKPHSDLYLSSTIRSPTFQNLLQDTSGMGEMAGHKFQTF